MAVIAAIAFSFSVDLPKRHAGGFKSDESTYFAITQSLAYDQDLRYEHHDLQRISSRFITGPMGIFLSQKEDGKIFYAKSFAYPLWAAPFFRLFDTHGILLFNSLMIISCLLMGYRMLRPSNTIPFSLGLSIVFTASSVVPVYLWWMTADLFNYFICFTGLFFFFYPFRRPAWHTLAGFFFAFAVYSKPSTAIPLAIVCLLPLLKKEYKRFFLLCLAGFLTISALLFFQISQSGDINYMAGERKSFHFEYPFQKPGVTFDNAQHSVKMTFDNYWDRFYISPRLVATNLFYFFFGRFSGLFIYFFFALMALAIFFFRKKRLQEWILFTAVGSSILVLVTLVPNYFGGSGTVGNRYFMTIYPLFFFLVHPISVKAKHLLVPTGAGLLFILPILMDGMYMSATPRYPAISGFSRFFPPEKTLYQSLPTNENARAFGRWYGLPPNRFQVFFLNDNFRIDPDNEFIFWTQPNPQHRLEAFLVTRQKVRSWQAEIQNIPLDNRVTLRIDDQREILNLPPEIRHTVEIQPAFPPLQVEKRFVYHLVVECSRDFVPYLADIHNGDLSHRGVGIQLSIKD